MDFGVILLLAGVAWFVGGIIHSQKHLGHEPIVTTGGASADENLGSIYPGRWIPPFLRDQFVQEEVVEIKTRVVGYYDDPKLDFMEFRFKDRQEKREYRIKFAGGVIMLVQKEETI